MKQILLSLIFLIAIFSEASTNEWNRKNSCSYESSGLVERLLSRMTLEQTDFLSLSVNLVLQLMQVNCTLANFMIPPLMALGVATFFFLRKDHMHKFQALQGTVVANGLFWVL